MTTASTFTHPCLTCGACCAHYRVGMHWSETEPELGGRVPVALTESLRLHERAMRGTCSNTPRCIALDAEIGRYSRCTIHPQRPSACEALPASWEFGAPSRQCDIARAAYGLPVLTAEDWPPSAQ
ncbi:zinc/iron-chelating domain-containing protein [Lysobacteraceae bacterium NML07-0707]|nr:zinc/iron-chelating domain-containing protein [Xanthomonadaceae bacterium NML07-0707]